MSGINPPERKGKKLRKRGRSHMKREKHSSSIRDYHDHEKFEAPTNQADQISNFLFPSTSHSSPKEHVQVNRKKVENQASPMAFKEKEIIHVEEEAILNHSQKEIDLNNLDMKEFILKFKRGLLLLHYNKDFAKVPIYLKASVFFITLLQKSHQMFRNFSQEIHEIEMQFIRDMNLYLTYFSLISVAQTIHLKKMFHQKSAESLHTKRAAHMAKVFHLFLKKNFPHWK